MMKNKLVLFVAGALALLILPLFAQYFGDGWVRILDTALLYMMLALGLNIVVGYAGLLDLGYVAFYAVGAYLFGLLASPHLTDTFDWFKNTFQHGLHAPIWLVIPLGRAGGGHLRRAAGRADAAAARRLPGHRHARLRRDHPRVPEQPRRAGQHHQRPEGHRHDRLDQASSASTSARRTRCSASSSTR